MSPIKRVLLLLVLVAAGYVLKVGLPTKNADMAQLEPVQSEAAQSETVAMDQAAEPPRSEEDNSSDAQLWQAFQRSQSDLQIEGKGKVSKLLKDDTQGSPHQRFLLRTSTGQVLLVAHNIELAPRLNDLAEGDTVRFYGEYEWNEKGGVIHWTHHDPQDRHAGGWLEHRGQRYE
jgi:hypothetical protein